MPAVLVHKKNQFWRLGIYYCRLNTATRKDAYPFLELMTVYTL